MDFLLKQRLVGAIVLVALAVIFIPMLLEGPGHTMVPEMDEFPEPRIPEQTRELTRFPAPDAIPEAPETAVLLKEPAPAAAIPEPEPEPEPEPVAPPPPPVPQAKPGPLDGWVVQVGSFSSEQNALALRDKLRKAGFTAQAEKARVDGKTRYRVQSGPFLNRDEAEKVRGRLAAKQGLQGRVLSYP